MALEEDRVILGPLVFTSRGHYGTIVVSLENV